MYSLEVICNMLCIPSTNFIPDDECHILNSAGALLVLLMAIQVVCCHYMLTRSVEYLWYVKF